MKASKQDVQVVVNMPKVIIVNYMKNRIAQSMTLFVLLLFLFSGHGVSVALDAGTSKVIFYVK